MHGEGFAAKSRAQVRPETPVRQENQSSVLEKLWNVSTRCAVFLLISHIKIIHYDPHAWLCSVSLKTEGIHIDILISQGSHKDIPCLRLRYKTLVQPSATFKKFVGPSRIHHEQSCTSKAYKSYKWCEPSVFITSESFGYCTPSTIVFRGILLASRMSTAGKYKSATRYL